MSDYLNTARAENFIGRHWLYREVEDTFTIESDVFGILILGNIQVRENLPCCPN